MIRRLTALAASLLLAACATIRQQPPPPKPGDQLSGLASWYGQEYAGRTTANGEIFDPMLLTAAHRTFPFGTVLRISNPKNGKSVDVRINDRGPFIGERVIDLSYGAAQQLDLIDSGVATVDMTVLHVGAGDREPPVPYVVSIPEGSGTPSTADAPPAVPFPIPKAETPSAGTAEPGSENVFGVQVQEEQAGQVTRKEVAPDGTTIRPVPVGPAPSAAPSTSPAATTPPPQPARRVRSGFAIQLGAFQNEQNAQALRQRAAALFPQAYVEPSETLFRVRVGPFATRAAAIDARERLETAGFSGMVVPAE